LLIISSLFANGQEKLGQQVGSASAREGATRTGGSISRETQLSCRDGGQILQRSSMLLLFRIVPPNQIPHCSKALPCIRPVFSGELLRCSMKLQPEAIVLYNEMVRRSMGP
jgi:hypothetical protein